MNIEKLYQKMEQLRLAMQDFAASAPDDKAYRYPSLFPAWKAGTDYAKDDRVECGGKLWKCLQPHKATDDWSPVADGTEALWVEIAAPGEYREIKSGMLSTEAFAIGEIGWYQTKDNLYRSLIDANVWTPDDFPSGWEKV